MKTIIRAMSVVFFVSVIFSPTAEACPTRRIYFGGNLDAAAASTDAPIAPLSWQDLDAAAVISTIVSVYDSMGTAHSIQFFFFHLNSANLGTWAVDAYVDGSELGAVPGQPILLASLVFTFTPGGVIAAPAPVGVATVAWSNGAKPTRYLFTLPLITNHAGTSTITLMTQDGSTGSCSQSAGMDFDGDGLDDIGIWRRQFGMWAILLSSSATGTDYIWKQWGLPGDYPMAGDYTGDGRADLVVWRPSNGTWYVCSSETTFDCTRGYAVQFGLPEDRPIKADFDGDGILDFAIWRPSILLGIYRSSLTGQVVAQQWGLAGDIPLDAGVNR